MTIPVEHQQIALDEYGYEIDAEIGAEYARQEGMCRQLAWAMGYTRVELDVPGRRVLAHRLGKVRVLADCQDPMNLWCYAWSRLHCEHIELPWWHQRWITFWEGKGSAGGA